MKLMSRGVAIFSMVALVCCVALLGACAANPFTAAKGVDEQAFAALGSYNVYQKLALKVVQDQSLPVELRRAAAQADADAFPVVEALNKALTAYLDVQEQLAAGKTSKEKLTIAIANLKDWTTKTVAVVDKLREAVKKKKPVARATPWSPTLKEENLVYVA